ncbi:hypothetical protein FM106_05165 [Brachybacterium faecium]|nr:hypothetical protein FM106_05165 [Brachybacterium faecium]
MAALLRGGRHRSRSTANGNRFPSRLVKHIGSGSDKRLSSE